MTESCQNKRIFSKDRILTEKRNILKIVEWMLEKNISKDKFLTYCEKLSQSDYKDVIEERSIEYLCGFPLCSKNIKVLNKKFHISTKVNKVYDITERKCFCSNECYKASNFVKLQLPSDPFWMREEKPLNIKLLSVLQNSGSAGEEVNLGFSLHREKDKESSEESALEEACTPTELLKKEMEKCSEQLKDLKVVENTFKPALNSMTKKLSTLPNGDAADDTTDSSTESEDSSSDSDSNVKYFTNYDNLDTVSHKLMPIPLEMNKSVLISPLNSISGKSNASISIVSKSDASHQTLSLDFAHHVLTCWITEDSIKYILGDYKLHSIKADMLFENIASGNLPSDKLKTMKDEYVALCLKLDRQEQEIEGFLEDDIECEVLENSAGNENSKIKPTKPPPVRRKSNKKSHGRKKKTGSKTVSFAASTKTEKCDVVKSEQSIILPALPPIDSKSQNMLRRQVVTNRLKISYFDILPLIGQSFKYIMEEIRNLIATFSLAPDNVTYKPKEWKLISLIIYRLISRTVSKSLCDDEKFMELVKLSNLPIATSLREIDELITDVSGAQQLQRLQGLHQNVEPKLS